MAYQIESVTYMGECSEFFILEFHLSSLCCNDPLVNRADVRSSASSHAVFPTWFATILRQTVTLDANMSRLFAELLFFVKSHLYYTQPLPSARVSFYTALPIRIRVHVIGAPNTRTLPDRTEYY